MPGFTADASLAAMSQRAAQLLRQRGLAATQAGGVAMQPQAQQAQQQQIPKSFLGNRVNQLGGLARMSASMVNMLKQQTGRPAMSREEIYARAAEAHQHAIDEAYGGMNDINDFDRGYFGNIGWQGSDESFRDWAAQHAPSYGGQQFVPHNIAQEGQITYQNGVPGVMVKFSSPGQGSSTEWVPLQ